MDLRKSMRVALKECSEIIIESSRKHHRFKSKSNNLEKARSVETVGDFVSIVWLDGSVSGAGKYDLAIHQGHSGRNTKKNTGNQTWKPDRFMFDAAKREKKRIEKKLKLVVDKHIKGIF